MLFTAALAPLAKGAPPKEYTLTASPAAVCFTGTAQEETFTIVLKNEARNNSLGSAEITAPSGLVALKSGSLSGAPGGSSLDGNVIKLRNLNLATGSQITITVDADIIGTGSGVWASVAKQSNDFADAPGPGNLFAPKGSPPPLTVSACELRFVTQPANPWEKNTTITPPVEVAVFSGTTRVAVAGTPALTASGAGSTADFTFGSATYSATTMSWTWPSAKPNTTAPSGFYKLTATLGAMTDDSDSDPGTAGDQPFRVTSSVCDPGDTCNVTSDLPGSQIQAGLTNTLPGSIAIDFETGADAKCDPWNRASYTNSSGDEVTFPGVALDYVWGATMLQLVYRIRNAEWVLTDVSRGNGDIEICAGARHGVNLSKNGDGSDPTPFQGKYGPAVWNADDGLYWGVLGTVSNPRKVKNDPAVCAASTQDLPTGPGGSSETWRTWTICIPFDWDWKNFG